MQCSEISKHSVFIEYLLCFLFRDEKNVFEALAAGASMSIALVANIACMLIAFLSMLRFLNTFLEWLGTNVGYSGLSFEVCF